MILWVKRVSAVANGTLLLTLLFSQGHPKVALLAAALNLGWAIYERMPSSLGKFLPSTGLVVNTGLSAYGILAGAPAGYAVLVAVVSLVSWNTSLFLERWPDAPHAVQHLYLRRLGGLVALGVGAGLSALALQGSYSLPFPLALSVVVISGLLWLRLISGAIEKER
jgi:hypothetical protein